MSMRSHLAILLASQLIVADFAAAALSTVELTGSTTSSVTGIARNQSTALAQDEWLTLRRTISVRLLEEVGGEPNVNTGDRQDLTLVEGTELQILKISADGRVAYIGLDEDISEDNPGVNGADPVLASVDLAELQRGKLAAVDVEGIEVLGTSVALDSQDEYVRTDVAARRGGHARRRGGRGRRGGMTYCLRDVRLTAARYTHKVPQGIPYASIALPRYVAAGWRRVPPSAWSSAPIGTACFSGGGRSCGRAKCGHAAIKIGPNTWKGAGIRPTPWLPGRNAQGCAIPPGK